MAESVKDVMTRDPRTVDAQANLVDVARAMKEEDVGSVIVTEQGQVTAIVTDRDIAIRAVAEDRNPRETTVADVCSGELTTLSPDDSLDEAVARMRQDDIRRLPVIADGKPVGILSLGDLAVERDPDSVLADISAAPPNE